MKKLTKAQVKAAVAKRVEALEKAITKALKKHKFKLSIWDSYISRAGSPDACVCAVGAALIASCDKDDLVQLEKDVRAELLAGTERLSWADERVRRKENRAGIMRWAARVVDKGIKAEDLVQLENGFENLSPAQGTNARLEAINPPDLRSPYYKLGQKLRRAAKES